MDDKWIDALRRFMGNGKGYVPVWKNADGSIDANATLEAAFGMYGILPRVE